MSVNERVQEELEALEAILLDDISIVYDEQGRPELVKSTIFPSTANEVNKQYVRVTLEVRLPEDYPDCMPNVQLRNPRGLDDSTISEIYKSIGDKCAEYVGQPVIFELIELIRESLTESNLPTCQCAVCLYGFTEGDSFTKTECYHYFHSYCLHKHLVTTKRHYQEEQDKLPLWQKSTKGFQATCPVCRESINCDVEELKSALPPKDLENAQKFEVTSDLRILQEHMKELFTYQKSKGGIIDIEAEENKLLLITETNEEEASDTSEDPGPSDTMLQADVLPRNQRYDCRINPLLNNR
ncbi:E3 ubiquitin-protein ligase RNF25 [Diabrotica virgifera virgifera]|uniref:E3 ubiquitin-protein ligase RNF25 n=1 Tax=Diabrotica virgifera virgifera TaxID=50390 RepID=A0A6P7G2I8_DIAVI|nr:E3 ubiquitin-protein ligase RNF25 [Diabrotica virgifera virgifera]